MFVGVSGAHKDARPHIGINSAWVDVQEGFTGVSGVWGRFFVNFEVSTSPTTRTTPSGGSLATSGPVTTTVVGPSNVTHEWEALTNPSAITINSPSAATTTFTGVSQPAQNGDPASSTSEDFRDKVTNLDSGEILYGETVTVTFTP